MRRLIKISILMLLLFPLISFSQSTMTYNGDSVKSSKISDGRRLFGLKSSKKNCLQEFMGAYKYGYLDSNGNCVIEPIYDMANDFVGGLAIVQQCSGKDGQGQYYKWHILPNGKRLYQQKYVEVEPFCGDYAKADKDGGYHYCHINKQGDPLYSQTYKWLTDFNKFGRAAGIKEYKYDSIWTCLWVVLDTDGKEIYSCWKKRGNSDNQLPEELNKYLRPE